MTRTTITWLQQQFNGGLNLQPDDVAPKIQDSVVGGDLNTGTVIHNHYQSQPSSFAPQPQTIVGIPSQIQDTNVGVYGAPVIVGMGGPDKNLRTISWILVLIGLIGGFMCGILCLLVPIGLIPEAMYLHQSINWKKRTGAPTGGDTTSLILVYLFIVGGAISIIYMVMMIASFGYGF